MAKYLRIGRALPSQVLARRSHNQKSYFTRRVETKVRGWCLILPYFYIYILMASNSPRDHHLIHFWICYIFFPFLYYLFTFFCLSFFSFFFMYYAHATRNTYKLHINFIVKSQKFIIWNTFIGGLDLPRIYLTVINLFYVIQSQWLKYVAKLHYTSNITQETPTWILYQYGHVFGILTVINEINTRIN